MVATFIAERTLWLIFNCDRSHCMKKAVLLIILVLAVSLGASAKGLNSGARQRSGATSRGRHGQTMSAHNQFGQAPGKGQMNGSHQMRNGQMGGAQQMGRGNTGQGNVGSMNQNGHNNGSNMGNGGSSAGPNGSNGMMQGQSATTQQP
jgi:hypothetical protein